MQTMYGPQDLRYNMVLSSLVLFFLIHPRLEAEEVSNREIIMGTYQEKKRPNRSMLSLAKGLGKE